MALGGVEGVERILGRGHGPRSSCSDCSRRGGAFSRPPLHTTVHGARGRLSARAALPPLPQQGGQPLVDFLIGLPSGLEGLLGLLAALVASYLLLAWVTSVLWTFRDARARTPHVAAQAIGVALVALIPLLGITLYLILRPGETLQQAYDRDLEQQTLLAELQAVPACPGCQRAVRDEFTACPYCRTTLKEPCSSCGHQLAQAWRHCPYCATTRAPERAGARRAFGAARATRPLTDASEREQGEAGVPEAALRGSASREPPPQ
ncbi:MAG: zinc ribbon domain-containing protein [Dehalococcoidia bacterium]|nr:zinc ribbon domain-containing protein [Dehalococcoidia bacterium]